MTLPFPLPTVPTGTPTDDDGFPCVGLLIPVEYRLAARRGALTAAACRLVASALVAATVDALTGLR